MHAKLYKMNGIEVIIARYDITFKILEVFHLIQWTVYPTGTLHPIKTLHPMDTSSTVHFILQEHLSNGHFVQWRHFMRWGHFIRWEHSSNGHFVQWIIHPMRTFHQMRTLLPIDSSSFGWSVFIVRMCLIGWSVLIDEMFLKNKVSSGWSVLIGWSVPVR